jgi:branched-chain amino acid transport system permease protein
VVLGILTALTLFGMLSSPAGAADAAIKVRVQNQTTDDAGKGKREPVAGVAVSVLDAEGNVVATGVTDDKGEALLVVGTRGSYTIVVDEATLPEGFSLAANTPAERKITEDEFRTDTITVNYFTGEATRLTTGWWSALAQRLADGARLGLVLAMCSVGLSLIFGTTGLTNFAHGELVTLGAMYAYLLSVTWDWMPLLMAIPIAVALGGLTGLAFDGAVFGPLRKRKIGLVSQLVVSVGLSILLKNLVLSRFGGRNRQFAEYNRQTNIKIGPVGITPRDLIAAIISLVVLVTVALVLTRSRLGKATRAVSDNPDLASSTGIDSQRIIRIVWFVGGGLAALGGIFRGLDEGLQATMGSDLIFLLFAGITLGGLGSAYGALAGGFVVGIFVEVSTLGLPIFPDDLPRPLSFLHDGVPSELKNVPALLALVVILLVRPQGILGRRERVG